ncbi:hypothetical protein ACFJIX_28845 [Roseateles sp. UC29_93]|uniref:hypothetical protein n=1 Tax=Roseateles sp. UC29_93 TaxID=3350177 RepID=UPI00367320FE
MDAHSDRSSSHEERSMRSPLPSISSHFHFEGKSTYDRWFGVIRTTLGGGGFLSVCSGLFFPQGVYRDLAAIAIAAVITLWLDRNERNR